MANIGDREAWLFSVKTYGAALLALYVALASGLDRPGWAVTTVYVVSQPFAAATASKSLYRLVGTILGAVASVVLVPALVQAPELLCVALALWVAGCLYISLQDRSPRSYVFMLAGYSVAFIAFPGVDSPENIFNTAVARVEEIALAVVCSALVHSLVAPKNVVDAIRARVDAWMHDSKRWAATVLHQSVRENSQSPSNATSMSKHPIDLETLLLHLAFESSELRTELTSLRSLQWNLEKLLPILSSIEDRLASFRAQNAELPSQLTQFIALLNANLDEQDAAPSLEDLYRESLQLRSVYVGGGEQNHLLWLGLLERFRELLEVMRACAQYKQRVDAPGLLRNFPRKQRSFRFKRHIDRKLVALSCATAMISILAGCSIWIFTGWTDGASVPMIAAVACSFFATQDSPLPSMKKFGKFAFVAIVISLIYSAVILPAATTFEMAALFMAPAFLVLGLLIARPQTNFVGMVISTNVSTLVGLNNRYVPDFTSSLNSGLALMIGIFLTMLVMAIMRARSARWSAIRIAQAARRDLMQALRAGDRTSYSRKARVEFIRRMLDRFYLLSSRLKSIEDGLEHRLDETLLRELRVGANAIDLRRLGRKLPPSHAEKLRKLLMNVEQAFASRPGRADRLPQALRNELDDVLHDILTLSGGRVSPLAIALSGMRLAMFPNDQLESRKVTK
ncbi:putative membrane protein YccC [Paraburkholderia sp. RAU2J]|uniref:FUSC family protein n=1 Tax=Paraburkholderia sp. RAU2J TaxID=1938810 RepID=UPI000EAF1167|nr:FUSC family protein [Paraburkholderia sp. RAU2J]RKT20345.1 putative membrane protein YccC [Paraburkholderia sp. RAU2J]